MEFSIKLSGWVLGDPVFHKKKNMVSKHFILHDMHFKANLFMTPLTPLIHPTTHTWAYRGGDTKRGEGGLIKVKKQVDFKIHFRWFKAFLDHVFVFFFH